MSMGMSFCRRHSYVPFSSQTTLTLRRNESNTDNLQDSVTVAVRMGPFRSEHWINRYCRKLEKCVFVNDVKEIVLEHVLTRNKSTND
mmetsp:Transcript_21738/g.53262  ORF Transcript_21738/g.53262 Transcript_21738/m.53262 type:complete len:87 (-) Transcript_21738:199-459(-)